MGVEDNNKEELGRKKIKNYIDRCMKDKWV